MKVEAIFIQPMKRYFIFIVLFVLIFNQKIARVDIPITDQALLYQIHEIIDQKKAVKIDSFFTERSRLNLFNGAILFAERGRIIYEKAFGLANFKDKTPLELDSRFQLASVTKPITACAILMLYEEGKLDLEEDIRNYFPAFPYPDVTVRLLLTHRSGLPDYMYFTDDLWRSRQIEVTNRDILDLMILYKPFRYYQPDRRYNYSNTNYAILALIIEEVSGLSYADFLKENIFAPLGMKDTEILTYEALKEGDLPSNLATGYHRLRRKAENSYLNGVVGDKGIYSTVEDLYKFDQALYQGKLISLFTQEEAFTPAHSDLRDYDNYGFGWRISKKDTEKIVFHSGWWKGYKTYFVRKIDEQKTIIILTNTAHHHFLSLRRLCELL